MLVFDDPGTGRCRWLRLAMFGELICGDMYGIPGKHSLSGGPGLMSRVNEPAYQILDP